MAKCRYCEEGVCKHISSYPNPDGSLQRCNLFIQSICEDYLEELV